MKTEISTYEQQAIDFLTKTNTSFTAEFLKHGKHFDSDTQTRDIYKITLKRGKKKYSFNFGQSINNSCKEIEVKQRDCKDIIEVFAELSVGSGENKIHASVTFKLYKKDDFYISDEQILKLSEVMNNEYTRQLTLGDNYWRKKFEDGDISRKEMQNRFGKRLDEGAPYQCIQNAIKRELDKLVPVYVESENKISPTEYDVLACLTKYDPGTFENFCSEFGYDTDSRSAEKTYNAVKDEYNNLCALFNDEEMQLMAEIQ